MKKLCATAILMASIGLLAACQDQPEDKMESARESMSDAMDNVGDAMESTGDAIEQKADQTFNDEPTTGERIQENLDAAGDRISEAYDDSTDYLQEKGQQAKDAAAEARDDLSQRMNGEYPPAPCCIPTTIPAASAAGIVSAATAPGLAAIRETAPVSPSTLPARWI